MANNEESSLIDGLKQRDRSAWSTAADRHLHEVYGFVFHLVGGDRAIAEDLNQETWIAAMDGIDHCDSAQGSFRNWLYGIARKRVALHYRRRATAGNAMSLSDQTGQAVQLGDDSLFPEEALEQMERNSVVRAAMMALPGDRREVLLCKYVEGLSVDKIAERMGRTAKAVESLLSRSREQLREVLSWYTSPRQQPTKKQGVIQ